MSDFQSIADRIEIEVLHGEFTDAVMRHDYDRLASLFLEDGAVRMPHINAEARSREEIRAAAERLQSLWEYFVQTIHRGTVRLEGDSASGRVYIAEFGRLHDGSSHLNYGVYHDRYQRTPAGWKFAERTYEIMYLDTTPLPGRAPRAQDGAQPMTASSPSTTSPGSTNRSTDSTKPRPEKRTRMLTQTAPAPT
jgi:ketosteroid isomerase-like protein